MKTRMWVIEYDRYGFASDRQFFIDDPVYVPRLGEIVEHENAFGEVIKIQTKYESEPLMDFAVIIYVYLKYRG